MAENDFGRMQGDSFSGDNFANFTGGGISPQGNVSSGQTTDAATSAAASQASNTTGAAAPATIASPGLVTTAAPATPAPPSIAKLATGAVLGSALPYAGAVIGRSAGAALSSGSGVGTAISDGLTNLGSKIGIGTGGATADATSQALSSLPGDGPANLGSGAAGSTLGGAAGVGIGAAAATLLTGGGIKKAATTGVGSAVGYYGGTAIGTAVGGPVGGAVGGFIGGAIGGAIGGRVICTQLVKDGLISKEDQRLDMDFTFHALSNIHVRGYLFWARGWVEKMNESDKIRAATLKIVVWRLNEIKYQVGLSDKPDWRGKAVRFIMENFCLAVGLFVPDTSESVIYKKENTHVPA